MHYWPWILTLLLSACATEDFGGPPASERTLWLDDELSQGPTGGLTAGWVENDVAGNPLAGAFFHDGGGDVRARSDTHFLDDLRVPPAESGSDPVASPHRDRMLVYTGQFVVEVAKADESMARMLAKVGALGGYLQRQDDSALTVRVPADRFDDVVAWLREAGRVLSESRQADDVTEEFADLGIRLDNARRSRERLLEVLQKSEKVPDILAVEKELRRLTEEIERMEGRLKLLRDRVAMATLRVAFQSVASRQPAAPTGGRSRFRWINRVGMRSIMEAF